MNAPNPAYRAARQNLRSLSITLGGTGLMGEAQTYNDREIRRLATLAAAAGLFVARPTVLLGEGASVYPEISSVYATTGRKRRGRLGLSSKVWRESTDPMCGNREEAYADNA